MLQDFISVSKRYEYKFSINPLGYTKWKSFADIMRSIHLFLKIIKLQTNQLFIYFLLCSVYKIEKGDTNIYLS